MPAIETPAAYVPGRWHLQQVTKAKDVLTKAEAAQALAEAKLSDIRTAREADLAAGRRPSIDRNRLGAAEDAAEAAQRRTTQLRREYEAVRDATPSRVKLARARAESAKIAEALPKLTALLEEAAKLVAACRDANAALYAELRGASHWDNEKFAARLSGLCDGILRHGDGSERETYPQGASLIWTEEAVEKRAIEAAIDAELRSLRVGLVEG